MKKTTALVCCLFLALSAGCGMPRRGPDPATFDSKRKTSFDHFGTVCFAVVFDDFSIPAAEERFENAWREIDAMLTDLENTVSVTIPESDIARFNAASCGEPVAVRPLTAKIMSAAAEMYRLTGGAYNPAVANLVDLWAFSPRFGKKETASMPYDRPRNADGGFNLPDRRYIEAFKKLSDFTAVVLSGNEKDGYFLTKQIKDISIDGVPYSLKIDFGGIAKGVGADMAAGILKKHGYRYGYINLGLSSLHLLQRNVADKGAPAKHLWGIDLPNPLDRMEKFATVFAKDTGLSTSGAYDRNYLVDGKRYSHLIDPATGEPTASDILSATVLGADAGYADALSTALCVMGKEKAGAFIRERLAEYRVACLIKSGDTPETLTNMKAGDIVLDPFLKTTDPRW